VYALRGGMDLLGIVDARQNDGELVTAQASDSVVPAYCVAEARGDFAQELVADLMSVLIVQLLEASISTYNSPACDGISTSPERAISSERPKPVRLSTPVSASWRTW
jgi:hypothetical protein